MKHLKKFNESVNIEDIKDMFLEVTDITGANIEIEELKDYFNSDEDFSPEMRIVGYQFSISLKSPFSSKGNPYSSSEVDISVLKENMISFSNLINKVNDLILESLDRVISAGYKVTHYSFRAGTEATNFPKNLLLSFSISI